jgi:hypothetical protein
MYQTFLEQMMRRQLVNAHIRRRLEEHGYTDIEDDDIEWSLNYCQGDGVAFYGSVASPGKLAQRAFPGDSAKIDLIALACARDAEITIERNDMASRYAHAHTMTVYDHDNRAFEPDDEMSAHERLRLARAEAVFEEFVDWIQEDIRSLSKTLEAECYKILEAGNPNWLADGVEHYGDRRCHCTVETWELDDATIEVRLYETDFYGSVDHDEDELNDLLDRIIAGKTVYYDLMVAVLDEDGNEIGEAWAVRIEDDRNYRTDNFKDLVSELIAEAMAEAGVEPQPAATEVHAAA